MKTVLVIGRFTTESFALHIAETLVDMGYNVERFVPDRMPASKDGLFAHRINQVRRVLFGLAVNVPSIRAWHMKALWNMIQGKKIDYVISTHDFLQPNEVKKLKTLTNAKLCMWFPDTLVTFGKAYFMNSCYDGLFFKDPYIIKALFKVPTSPIYYMPECFNPKKHRFDGTVIESKYKCDITTAGNAHSWRVAFYNHLSQYNVKIWGPRAPIWMPKQAIENKFQSHLVYNEEKAKAFLGAKIVVNNLLYGEIWGLNVRTFEAAGIGAFQMVDWRAGLSQLFEDGKEIVSFNSLDDMHQKIDYYLQNPELRDEIAKAGKVRALREHTYELRLKLILETLDGNANGFALPMI